MLNRFLTSVGIVVVVSACATPPPQTQQEIAPVVPVRFTYQNGHAQYEYTSHRIMNQEVAGQMTRNEATLRVLLSTTITETDANRTVRFIVDSILDASGPGFTIAMQRAVSQLDLVGPFQSTGAITTLPEAGQPSSLMANITVVMNTFFPRIPIGGAEAGEEWADTTEVTTNDGSTRITKRSIVYSTAGEWSEDGSILPVAWRSEYTLTGQGQQMGQNFTLTGGGMTSGEHLLSADGVFFGMASRDSSSAEVELPAIGITVPIVQAVVDSVRIVR